MILSGSKDLVNKGFSDISNIAHICSNMEGDSMTQLQAMFAMVDDYKNTNPKEFEAMDSFIGKRCAYRKDM